MIVAGVMSGTSADGINVALVRFRENPHSSAKPGTNARRQRIGRASKALRNQPPTFEFLDHAEYPYPKNVRAAVLASMNADRASVADLARLNFLLGELYADAVVATQRCFRVKADLVGCHGQTLYHQGKPAIFLGRKIAATWQTGEGAIIAARTGVPVISDFRPSDMAAGGHGAPLVPFLDYALFRDARIGRIVQNIGGIANLTAIPAGARASEVIAFDTGPGNMVIDAVTEKLFGEPFDRGGRTAGRGTVLEEVIKQLLCGNFFSRKPPKTAGREEFGREFTEDFLRLCRGCRKQDVVATATALTAKSIAYAISRHVMWKPSGRGARGRKHFHEIILSGGGGKNSTLVAMLKAELDQLGIRLRSSDEFGLPSAAKEAVAFALLAYETWHRRPSNVPPATGAKRAAVLGKISYP
jgi:anhydro-N-acetylmuramic acid kinase